MDPSVVEICRPLTESRGTFALVVCLFLVFVIFGMAVGRWCRRDVERELRAELAALELLTIEALAGTVTL